MRKYAFLIILMYLLVAAPQLSAESISLRLVPNKYNVIAKPNATITLPYTVYNLADAAAFNFDIYALQIQDNRGNLTPIPCDPPNSEGVITCEGFTFRQIDSSYAFRRPLLMYTDDTIASELEIQVPANAELRDFYFSLIVTQDTQTKDQNNSSVKVKPTLAIPIAISISTDGRLDQNVSIVNFSPYTKPNVTLGSTKYYFADSNSNVLLKLDLANTGIHAASVSGQLRNDSNETTPIEPFLLPAESQRDLNLYAPPKLFGVANLYTDLQTGNADSALYASTKIIYLPFVFIGIISTIAFGFGVFLIHRYVKIKK